MAREAQRRARSAVTVCEYNRGYIAERVPGADLDLVICGVDPETFQRSRPYDPRRPGRGGRAGWWSRRGSQYLVRAAASVAGGSPRC